MPNIYITETEAEKLSKFDVTENTVLIPMLWKRGVNFKVEYDSEENPIYFRRSDGSFILDEDTPYADSVPAAKRYTGASEFADEVGSHVVQVGTSVNSNLDRSYIMAYELLLNGINVVLKPIAFDQSEMYFIEQSGAPADILYIEEGAYEDLLAVEICDNNILKEFEDKNTWNIKFITTGGYANVPEGANTTKLMYKTISTLASTRGDAVALIEPSRNITTSDSEIITQINYISETNQNSAIFIPWGVHTGLAVSSLTLTEMPACFSYLMAYANSVKTNANWFAAAGVIRGEVPTLKYPVYEIGEALMHILQRDTQVKIGDVYTPLPVCTNVIMNAGTYGYRIWGNKVAKPTNENLVNKFVDFLNVRILLCDIRKQVYNAAMRVMFEPNDDIAWFNFKYLSEDLLEKMKSGRGISWYKWTKNATDQKATINASLTIRPIEALENITVEIVMTDEEVEVAETTAGTI